MSSFNMSKTSRCSQRKGEDGSLISRQLAELGQRMNHLELCLADLTGEGTKRVLDRMHELEEATRNQCNDLLHIMDVTGRGIDDKIRKAELLVMEADAKCTNIEMVIRRRGDRERKDTTDLLRELKGAISAVDQQATDSFLRLGDKIAEAERHISALDTAVKEVHLLCERAEDAAAQAQDAASTACRRQSDEWVSSKELKRRAVQRARGLRSANCDPGQVAWCIHLAQEAASRSPSRCRSSSADRGVSRDRSWSASRPARPRGPPAPATYLALESMDA